MESIFNFVDLYLREQLENENFIIIDYFFREPDILWSWCCNLFRRRSINYRENSWFLIILDMLRHERDWMIFPRDLELWCINYYFDRAVSIIPKKFCPWNVSKQLFDCFKRKKSDDTFWSPWWSVSLPGRFFIFWKEVRRFHGFSAWLPFRFVLKNWTKECDSPGIRTQRFYNGREFSAFVKKLSLWMIRAINGNLEGFQF